MDVSPVPEPSTRQAAIGLVTAVLRDDVDAVRCVLNMCDEEQFVGLLHATLALLRALAARLRSAEGLMAVDVWLAETSHDEHRSHETRTAAKLLLGHAQTCYPPVETIAAAESFGPMHNIGVDTFNAACCEADDRIAEVFYAVMALWRTLLPEVDTDARECMVGNTAGELWGTRSAEPAPPKQIQNLDGRTTLKVENRDVERRDITDMTAPPPPSTLPPGAPRARGEVGPGAIPVARPILPVGVPASRVSLAGLAELRQRAAQE